MPRLPAIIMALSGFVALSGAAHAANPLSPAERQVCRDLPHCLKIMEAHPHDSYDYTVLAGEFERFGKAGRAALVKRVGKPGAGAGHAADLLAEIGDAAALPALRALAARSSGETKALAQRTVEAISIPRRHANMQTATPLRVNARQTPICGLGAPIPLSAQKREMPFFEADIARPDESGRYRPSPALRVSLPHTDRAQLNSALPRLGGWLAGYEGGLIYYDATSGAPTMVFEQPIHSLQRMEPTNVASPVWALSQGDDGLSIFDASPPRPKTVASLPGQLAELRRAADGSLYASSDRGETVRLRPDGQATRGCSAEPPA